MALLEWFEVGEAGFDADGQFGKCRDPLLGPARDACGLLETCFGLLEGMSRGSGVGGGPAACVDQAGIGEEAGDDGVLPPPLFEIVAPLLEQRGGSQGSGRVVEVGEAGAVGRPLRRGERIVVAGFGVRGGLSGGSGSDRP
ncbi:hypothetical protein ACPCTN_31410 [Streptomyces cinereoruber]|uniref:hypothetical protein n=1 Tax=Streptomyces cinereoruber TaxID=67260 RepID=UPI003C2AC80E